MKDQITVDGTVYIRENAVINSNKDSEKYEWLKDEIQNHYTNAADLYNDYKEHGLTFNTVESEVYLRSAIQIKELVHYIEDNT